jgi:hypothetical protein
MINEKINDHFTMEEFKQWVAQRFPKTMTDEEKRKARSVWYVWDGDQCGEGDLWDKDYAYIHESKYHPQGDPTNGSSAQWAAEEFFQWEWIAWDMPQQALLYLEDELGRRFKVAVTAKQTVEYTADESAMSTEEAWPEREV